MAIMGILIEALLNYTVGPLLDSLGTRDEVVNSNGNITVYNIVDRQTDLPIGHGVMMVRDGMYVSKKLDEPSTLRKQFMDKLGLKGGDNV